MSRLLSLLSISALLTACTLPPNSLPPPGQPGPSSPPVVGPTASPTPEPGESPGPGETPRPSVPPLGDSDCHPDSEGLRVRVYSNSEYQFFDSYGTPYDKRQPIAGARVEAGAFSGITDASGEVILPRPAMEEVPPIAPDQPVNWMVTVTVSAAGHVPISTPFYNERLCASQYVALSPLSPAERAAEALPLELHTLSGDLEALHQDPASGLYHGVISTLADLEAFKPHLRSSIYSGEGPERVLQSLAEALAAGKQVALISDGKMFSAPTLVQRVSRKGSEAVLASHTGVIQSDPPPPLPVGDRFEHLIELVILPAEIETLRYEVFPFRSETGTKLTASLQVKASRLPIPGSDEGSAAP